MAEFLRPDEKGRASIALGKVIESTADNHPDPRFRPQVTRISSQYSPASIDMHGFLSATSADGVGTKPELAERLYDKSKKAGRPDASVFEGIPVDALAMVLDDDVRFGRYPIGVTNILDVNDAADDDVIFAIAKGLQKASRDGEVAVLNGETAELGYRMAGYGVVHVNMNVVSTSVFNPEKLLSGEGMEPGQPIVVFREKSIRSNGLTKARKVLDRAFKYRHGVQADDWHTDYPYATRELLRPSTIYAPVITAAQGRIDAPREIEMIAAAHISGGGVPEKAKRMVERKGLGVALDTVFPDPEAVSSLLQIASNLPDGLQRQVGIDDKSASRQWNRGVGFMVVTPNIDEAERLVDLASSMGREAVVGGKIIDARQVQWRGTTWNY